MHIDRIEAAAGTFVTTAVEWLVKEINKFLIRDGECILGLSGGSTPLPVYAELGKRHDVDWTKVRLFMVDERHVPDDNKDSNLKAIHETLLKPGLIPSANLVFPKVNSPYDECIADYDAQIKELVAGSPNGKLSIAILGLGEDGHFASLFPNAPAEILKAAFDPSKYVIGTTTDVFAVHNRITTTYTVLNNVESSVFLLKGKSKVAVFDASVTSSEDHTRWPAKPVLQSSHTTVIFEQ